MKSADVYPEPLHAAVARARSMRAIVVGRSTSQHPWFVGRVGELDAVVAAVLADWTRGALHRATAAGQLMTYLDELERGLEMAETLSLLSALPAEDTSVPERRDETPCSVRASAISRFDTDVGDDVDPWSLVPTVVPEDDRER